MAPAQMVPIGFAIPLPAMSAPNVHGSNMDGSSLAGLRFGGRGDSNGAVHAGPRSERMSPNKLLPTTRRSDRHAHEVRRQDVDVILVDR